MKKILTVMVMALLGVALLTSGAFAQAGKKIAVLNLSKLFDSYEKTKEYQKQLDDVRASYQKELDDRNNKIKDAEDKLAALKEGEKANATKEINNMKAALAEFVQTKRTDLLKQEEEKTREILLEMEKMISDYAKKEGIDMVINDRVLLYSNTSLDVTDPIIKMMNESYNKK